MRLPRSPLSRIAPPLLSSALLLAGTAATASAPAHALPTETKLSATDGGWGDRFGEAVAVDGYTVVVGAPNADPKELGDVYVFERDPSDPAVWIETAKLTSDGTDAGDFGDAVAISGDTIVVGSPTDECLGVAWVFERDPLDPTVWHRTAELIAADPEYGDDFGRSVAISGTTIVVGAPSRDLWAQDTGAAFVFERSPFDPAVWVQTMALSADNGSSQWSYFGRSVSISEDTMVIGCLSCYASLHGGRVYVFDRDPHDPTTWSETARLDYSEFFSTAVVIYGDTLVVGVRGEDAGAEDAGAAYVFQRDPLDPAVWSPSARLVASDGAESDGFGSVVALHGSTVLIAAGAKDDTSGAAYLFQRDPSDPSVWIEAAKLTASDGATGDAFGTFLALSGQTPVIGAPGDDDLGTSSGSAYVYTPDHLLRLAVSGTCPGTVTLEVRGATPGGVVAMTASPSRGILTLPDGRCPGTGLDLADPELLGVFTTDANGEVHRTLGAPAEACDLALQGLDGETCRTTDVERMP